MSILKRFDDVFFEIKFVTEENLLPTLKTLPHSAHKNIWQTANSKTHHIRKSLIKPYFNK